MVEFCLVEEGISDLGLAEVFLGIFDLEVLFGQFFVEGFLDVHRFELFLNLKFISSAYHEDGNCLREASSCWSIFLRKSEPSPEEEGPEIDETTCVLP